MPSVGLGSSTAVESVFIPMIAFLTALSEPNNSMVLLYDLLIFCPSVPGTTAVLTAVVLATLASEALVLVLRPSRVPGA